MEEPLTVPERRSELSDKECEKWSSAVRAGSVIPAASFTGTEVSVHGYGGEFAGSPADYGECIGCSGVGRIRCGTCGARGLTKCEKCCGSGSLITYKVAIVRWKTLSTKVSATSGAASIPDEVFHKAKGVQLCNTQAYQCTPAIFADSDFLNKLSSEVIAERPSIPVTAKVICERHTISVVPMTRVRMSHHGRSFSFHIIGYNREVYLKDYYPARFCWGLCPCLEWLKL